MGSMCGQTANLVGVVSAPMTSVPNLALQMSVTGTNGRTMFVTLGGTDLGFVTGNGGNQTVRVCMPDATKGLAMPIQVGLACKSNCACGGNNVTDFVIDDLKFVSDASCPASAAVTDGSFERTDPGVGYFLSAANNGSAVGASSIVNGAGTAHTGTHAFQGSLTPNTNCCAQSILQMPITVPPSVGNAGPAVNFWYKIPTVNNQWKAGQGLSGPYDTRGVTLTAQANYTQKTICLDPLLIGHATFFAVIGYVTGNGGTADSILVDDITVGTDPTCPTD
jgi:hypothetical protein